jgi:parvulin-like peptidyl-prolyl isomerase
MTLFPLRRSLVALAVVTTFGLGAACGPASTSSTSAPAASPPVVSPDTWASVDGRTITRDMVEKAYRRIADVDRPPSDEEALAAKLAVLNDLILQDILAAKARELAIEVAEADIDTAVSQARQGMTDETFQKELSRRNLTTADVRDSVRRDLLAQKVIEREVTSKIGVADQEVTAFFNANRDQFNLKEDAHRVAQIVVTATREPQLTNRTGDDAVTPEAATAKVEMLMGRLKSGVAFSDLAMDYSEDPESAPRGGDLGLVPASQLRQAPPALRDAVLKAEPGTVNVVSSSGGHIVVLVLSHERAGQRDLSMPEVKQTITDTLRAQKEQLLRTAYLTTARGDAMVDNYLARRLLENRGAMPSLLPAPPGQ